MADPTDLQTTPLTALHRAAGARMAPFAGWDMPVEFSSTLAEHEAVRTDVGVFDVSHLGTVWIEGDGATATIAASFTNDPTGLGDGESQYTLCCDERGGIVDDLIVYRLAADRWMTVPNAANTPAVVARLASRAEPGVEVTDASTTWAVLAVQGPRSLALVAEVLGVDPAATPYLGVVEVDTPHGPLVLCRTGYTGEVGCELVVPDTAAPAVWQALTGAGATPCGLAARDTLRTEMGYPLHGNDISTDTDPYAARLGWAVKLDRGGFVGHEALVAAKAAGPSRRLLALRTDGRRPPRPGMRVLRDGDEVGEVTSGTFSPTLKVGIGLAYLDVDVEPGEAVEVDVRGTGVPFEVARPPLVDADPRG
ncbi:MAG: glycine cleavage system aminomethyltransferase GcvT [Actinomycetes bacterium]